MRTKHTTNLSKQTSIIMENVTLTIKEVHDALDAYIEEGNAILIDGKWSTQDSMYANRLTKAELMTYFIKEYYPQYQ